MRSYIKIDSLFIDLTDYYDKSSDPGKCEHFSMRGYVSEIRQKDWKSCWPFPVQDNPNESEQSPLLPPFDVPKLSCRSCSQQELTSEGSHKDDGKDLNCCTAALNSDTHQQAPIAVTFEGKEIDLNDSSNLTNGNDHAAINNEKERKAEVEDYRINNEIGVEGLNHRISSVSSPILSGGMRQEQQTNAKGGEGKEVFDVELDPGNLKCKDKSSAETCNGGKPIVGDNQCPKETEKSCSELEKGTSLTEADKIVDQTAGLPPPDSVACHEIKQGSTDDLVKNEFQDHHLGKSTGLPRKKPRKVRLLTDLLSGNGVTKTEEIDVQESSFEGASIHQGNDQGDLTKTAQSRKRKFIVDEEQMAETDLENLKENTETIVPVLNNGSEDVFAGVGTPDVVKNNGCKPGIERSHIISIKKNKKIQFFGNHLLSEPQKGKQKQNQDKLDFGNDGYCSKTTTKLAPAPAFTEKGMSSFPFHAPRTENESKFSKGKRKMLQVDRDLPSVCFRNNGTLVENSVAHKTAKVMPNMSATVSNHSAEGLMNEKGLEEGLHLSLKSYLATQDYNKIRIHQNENQLPLSSPSQEGTSRAHQFVRKEWEINVGKPIIPFERITDDISGKRVYFEEITGARNMEETAEALEQMGMFNRYNDQTPDKGSEQESEYDDYEYNDGHDYYDGHDEDVPMDIVDFMAKFQYLRALPDTNVENSIKRSKTEGRANVGNTINGKGEQRLLIDDQKEISRGRRGENSMVMIGQNVRSRERDSVHCFSSSKGNPLNLSSLSQASLYGVEVSQPQMKPSSVFHFSPMSSSQLSSSRNHRLNGITAECGSSNPTLQSRGGCSLHQTILQQDDKASRVWGSLTPNPASLGYDIFKNSVISQSTSTKDMQKQHMKRNIDTSWINLNAVDYEKHNRERVPGPLSRMNAEYPFSCKRNGIEPLQNLRESQHMYSNETIPAMHLLNLMDASKQSRTPFNSSVNAQMLKRPLYPSDSRAKLEIGTTSKAPLVGSLKRPSSDHFNKSYLSEKRHDCFGFPTLGASSPVGQGEKFVGTTSFNGRIPSKSGMKDKMKTSSSAMHNRGNTQQLNWPYLEKETSLQRQFKVHDACGTSMPVRNDRSGSNICSINRNPADFTLPDPGNVYMIKGEDFKFEETSTSRNRLDLLAWHSCRQLKNFKPSKEKEY